MPTKAPTTKQILASIDNRLGEILSEVKKTKPPVEPTPAPANPSVKQFYRSRTQLTEWLEKNKTHPSYNLLASKIDNVPQGIWLNGSEKDIELVKITMENCGTAIPLFVVYAIPDRDAQQYSAGGFKTVEAYNKWAGGLGWAVKEAGNKECVFIVEPDALGLLNDRSTTYPCINAAVDILKKNSNTKVFIEGAQWVDPSIMADRVKGAGIERADGLCVNVSGYTPTDKSEAYAMTVLKNLRSGLQYIVDTSRNGGAVREGDWCNPKGAKLGRRPEIVDKGNLYAYAWIKLPSESDGECNGGPAAGQLWIERAIELAS